MVERRVPVPFLVRRPLDRRDRQHLVPLLLCGGFDAIKVPIRDFRFQIPLRPFRQGMSPRDRRQPDLHQQRLALLQLKGIHVPADIPRRAVETDGVPDLALDPALCPVGAGQAAHIPAVRPLAFGREVHVLHPGEFRRIVEHRPRLYEQFQLAVRKRRQTVDRGMRRRGDFDAHGGWLQGHGIVSGRRNLVGVVKCNRLRFPAAKRQEPHVAEIGAARAVQVGLGETADRLVAVDVAAAVRPVAVPRVRPRLHHPERHARCGKRMPHPSRPYERIDEINRLRTARGDRRNHQHSQQTHLHPPSRFSELTSTCSSTAIRLTRGASMA